MYQVRHQQQLRWGGWVDRNFRNSHIYQWALLSHRWGNRRERTDAQEEERGVRTHILRCINRTVRR